ncbi:putative replication protein A, OB [Helianthus annuus]|uniref:Replication protein A, OB n=1 Tax=Helianthus annuus TaxID=4232 RepID=A0A251SS18_HELAN|nr:putative replication protein A, OB [Helianthus annuus]KAJ0848673.1 putative replication protein A, OB [Helianthus annuus]
MRTPLSSNLPNLLVLNGDLIFLHLSQLLKTLIMTASHSKALLVHVIGFVVKCLPSEEKTENNNGKDEKKATFILEDLQHQQIYVTLWGVYADQIIEFQREHKDEKNVVVVVQFGKYRFWGGIFFIFIVNFKKTSY